MFIGALAAHTCNTYQISLDGPYNKMSICKMTYKSDYPQCLWLRICVNLYKLLYNNLLKWCRHEDLSTKKSDIHRGEFNFKG